MIVVKQSGFYCRTILGYWAGRLNSNVRDALSTMWQNDEELDIQNRRLNQSGGHHHNKVYRAKYCFCPRSSHDNNPFIADAIHHACVPGTAPSPLNLAGHVGSILILFVHSLLRS